MTGKGHSPGTRTDFHEQIKKREDTESTVVNSNKPSVHKRCSHVPIKDDFKKHKILMDGIYKYITYMLTSVVL